MQGGPAELVYGPVLIGLVFDIVLLGIIITQYYIYHTTYTKDPLSMKFFVWVLMAFDAANSVVNSYFVYDGVIAHFGDFEYIKFANWCIDADCVLTGVIEVMVQLFFAWRIHVLIKNWFLTLGVVLISLAGGVGAFVTTWKHSENLEYAKFHSWDGITIIWLACTGAANTIITVSLLWYLHTDKTGLRESDSMIDRIIRITVHTGLLTSIVAILDMVFFLADPTGTHLLFNTPMSKLYSNSLLSSLNSRGGWKFSTASTDQRNHHLSTFRAEPNPQTSSTTTQDTQMRFPKGFLKAGRSMPEVFTDVESYGMQDEMKRTSLTAKDSGALDGFSIMDDSPEIRYSAREGNKA